MANQGRCAMVSDAPFTGGWAVFPFQGEKAHHWKDVDGKHLDKYRAEMEQQRFHTNVHFYKSACGRHGYTRDEARAMPLMTPNWPKCKHCQRQLNKHMETKG